MRHRLVLAVLVALALAAPSEAGLFRRSPKPDPATHIPALIKILKSEKDERGRAAAANALREFDAKAFPEILPALTDALLNDPSSSVRAEAAESIGKVRPITAQAGYALEQAIANDKELRVRLAARTAMLQYRILGYFAGKEEVALQTAEPPLAATTDTKTTPGQTILRPTPSPVPVPGPVMPPGGPKPMPASPPPTAQGMGPRLMPQTGEPPLAEPPAPAPVLTTQPKAAAPVITIPPPKENVVKPIPTSIRPGPALPAPRELPDSVGKPAGNPAKPPIEGPTLPPPPKG